jgi:hypothetical protein
MADVSKIIGVYVSRPLAIAVKGESAVYVNRWNARPKIGQKYKTSREEILRRKSVIGERTNEFVLEIVSISGELNSATQRFGQLSGVDSRLFDRLCISLLKTVNRLILSRSAIFVRKRY